mgnify:CR=1 FL=1|tara:strand:- start:516 stop:752 length:237 start_codon:yes stop_codon:yes gene_type:complete
MSQSYNGWTNYETWNVALWLQNEEHLYHMMLFVKDNMYPYEDLLSVLENAGITKTGDGIRYDDDLIDRDEIVEMMTEN